MKIIQLDFSPSVSVISVCLYCKFSLCSLAGYLKSRQAVANFYSCPEAPLEAEVLTLHTTHTFPDTLHSFSLNLIALQCYL